MAPPPLWSRRRSGCVSATSGCLGPLEPSRILADFCDSLWEISIGLRLQYDTANGQKLLHRLVLPLEDGAQLAAGRNMQKSMTITLGFTMV